MIRKATLLPVKEKEVEWVRYTGDNLCEIEQFVDSKNKNSSGDNFYISTKDDKEIFWEGHGFIRVGDFVIFGMGRYINTSYDGFSIIRRKAFPRMVSEEIPVYDVENSKDLSGLYMEGDCVLSDRKYGLYKRVMKCDQKAIDEIETLEDAKEIIKMIIFSTPEIKISDSLSHIGFDKVVEIITENSRRWNNDIYNNENK